MEQIDRNSGVSVGAALGVQHRIVEATGTYGTSVQYAAVAHFAGSIATFRGRTAACPAPGILVQPSGATIASGTAATLSVTASAGGARSYQWYEGTYPDISTPVGADSAKYNTPALNTAKSYWVRVSSPCGTEDSQTANVLIQP
ncbi:MAG TPA: hypothetical protein VM534_02430 [Thermoanaerobaculia bacterium]|nr:hypothetical protein [Thermoanaerobaculia bacterium]